MLPATSNPADRALPSGMRRFIFVTVRPEALPLRTLDRVDRAVAVSDEAGAALAVFARAHGLPEPEGVGGVERGEGLTICRTDPAPRRCKVIPGTTERRRHVRKYAEGKLRLCATNLVMFLEMAHDGERHQHGCVRRQAHIVVTGAAGQGRSGHVHRDRHPAEGKFRIIGIGHAQGYREGLVKQATAAQLDPLHFHLGRGCCQQRASRAKQRSSQSNEVPHKAMPFRSGWKPSKAV